MSPRKKNEGDPTQQNPPIDVHTTINMPPRSDASAEPAGEKEKPDFWSYMQGLSEAEWRDHIVYLTRDNPRSSINGTGGYLTKFVQPFDIEDVKLAYGGYDFSYIMKKNNKIMYSGKFHVEAPPRLDATRELPPSQPQQQSGELVKEFIAVLRDELARSREANAPGAGSEHVVDMMAKASDRAMELVTRRAGEGGGLGNLTETIALVKSLMPPPAASPWDALASILKSPLVEPLVARLLSPPDPMAQISQLSGIIGAIDTLRGNSGGGGGGGNKDWKSQVVEGILTKAPDIIREIRETASESAKAAADRRAASEATERTAHVMATRGGPGAPPVQIAPPGATASPLRTVPIPPAGAPGEELLHFEEPVSPGVVDLPAEKKSDVIAEFIKTTLVRMFNDRREPDYVVDFLDEADPEICDQLVAYPAAAVTAYLANDPILAPMVNHTAWPAFLDQCRAYIQKGNDVPAPAEPAPV